MQTINNGALVLLVHWDRLLNVAITASLAGRFIGTAWHHNFRVWIPASKTRWYFLTSFTTAFAMFQTVAFVSTAPTSFATLLLPLFTLSFLFGHRYMSQMDLYKASIGEDPVT